MHECTDLQVLAHGEVRKYVGQLGYKIDAKPGHRVWPEAGELMRRAGAVAKHHRPMARMEQAVDRFQQRRLARAVRTNHGHDLA